MSDFEFQARICPICFDDHTEDTECKMTHLKRRIWQLRGIVNILADELAGFTGQTVPEEIKKARSVVDAGGER
jgi:hypothetical protein